MDIIEMLGKNNDDLTPYEKQVKAFIASENPEANLGYSNYFKDSILINNNEEVHEFRKILGDLSNNGSASLEEIKVKANKLLMKNELSPNLMNAVNEIVSSMILGKPSKVFLKELDDEGYSKTCNIYFDNKSDNPDSKNNGKGFSANEINSNNQDCGYEYARVVNAAVLERENSLEL